MAGREIKPRAIVPREVRPRDVGGTPPTNTLSEARVARAASEALGLVYYGDIESGKKKGLFHNIGTFTVGDAAPAIEALVKLYVHSGEGHYGVFSLREYLRACDRIENIKSQVERVRGWLEQEEAIDEEHWERQQAAYRDWQMSDGKPMRHVSRPRHPKPVTTISRGEVEFADSFSVDRNTADLEGYKNYLRWYDEELAPFLNLEVPVYLEEREAAPHSYVLGTTGAGKTELLKIPIHSRVLDARHGSVVVLDPHGEFVEQIAKWKEFVGSDRLIYVKPNLVPGMTPTINPFEISGVDPLDYSDATTEKKQLVADELVTGFEQMIADKGQGSNLTLPMRVILLHCVQVLLDRPGSTLRDLRRFMRDDQNEDLLEFAFGLSHHADLADYFRDGFKDPASTVTKQSIYRKLSMLLGRKTFSAFTCGRSTIDLEKAVNERKIILFNFSSSGAGREAGEAMARMIVSMLLGIAMRRDKIPRKDRVPCLLTIDECHKYLSASIQEILTDTRKYRLFLTLGQQMAGFGMTREMLNIVLTTTSSQFSGGAPEAALAKNAEMLGVGKEDIRKLERAEFFTRARRQEESFKLRTRSDLVDWTNDMSKGAWHRMKNRQLKRHYKGVEEGSESPEASTAETMEGRPRRRRKLV